MGYNLESMLTTATNELSQTTTVAYDSAGRTTSVTNARGDIESYSYNSNGWRTGVTNGRGYTRTYTRSSRGEVTALSMPDSTTEGWAFNGNGQVSGYTNGLNQTILYAYDDAGRLTTVDYPAGTDTAFTYDSTGRRTQMVDSTGTTAWTFDAANQLTQFSAPQGSVQWAFNTAGQPTSMNEVGLGATSYSYDTAGRLSSLTNRFSEVTSFAYDTLGRVSTKTVGSGAYETYAYDARSRVTTITLKNSSNTVLRTQSYTFDNASNVTGHTVDSLATTYGYDAIGQLTSESRTGYTCSYTYDANGNRATRVLNGVTETYTNDSGDKLTSVTWTGGSKTFGYDACGRTTSIVTSAGTTSLSYDYESRVTGITYPDASTNNFGYNGFDTRVSKTDSSGTSTYRRLGAGVTAPVLGDGSASYTPGLSERRGSTTTYQHSGIKNADGQTGSGQTLTATRQYDAFGNVDSSTGSFSGYFGYGGGFGYQSDADSSLKLLGHRYYDSSTGRFLTRDPIKDGRNNYSYVSGSPASRADPNGLFWLVLGGDVYNLSSNDIAVGGDHAGGHGVYLLKPGQQDMSYFDIDRIQINPGDPWLEFDKNKIPPIPARVVVTDDGVDVIIGGIHPNPDIPAPKSWGGLQAWGGEPFSGTYEEDELGWTGQLAISLLQYVEYFFEAGPAPGYSGPAFNYGNSRME